ncbi:MAG: hypothetical protein H7Y42_09045 [Chitinophagaceae bacterium]|nr:hypothetical protein [Chitinophagaceae bacterium]
MEITDDTIMPFGKKKGQRLADVSDGYLLTLYDSGKVKGKWRDYIENRIPILRQ